MIFGSLCACSRCHSSFENVARSGKWSRVRLQGLSGRQLRTIVLHFWQRVFNVKDFGAVADGIKDDSKAFETAWREACNWDGIKSAVLVPPGKYLVSFAEFEGPCKAPISFLLQGFAQAPAGLAKLPDKQSWISFQYLRHFTLSGEGTFHGQGETACPLNQCHKNSDCQLPTSIRFNFLNDSTITGIKSVDSRYFHINILGCYNLKLNDLKITAHADSPNTEGIHIGSSNGSEISHSVIATGDDCVSLGQAVKIFWCLTSFADQDMVPSQVKTSNVRFNNIRGTSANKVEGPETTSLCSNVKPTLFGKQIPATCV
ncbi:polygalacturonase [Citrus sinensis]|nr:polygalacturonase [Citrus sinensis]